MRKVDLRTNGIKDFSYLDFDTTYRMAPIPYPPDPSYDFIFEENGKLTKLLEIWRGYFDALFFFAHEQNLINSDFGEIWYGMCWICDTDGDWELTKEDVLDFISILTQIKFHEVDKEKERIFLPKIEELEELRKYILNYFKDRYESAKIYFCRS